MSIAGVSLLNLTYAFFLPAGVVSVLILVTFDLNTVSISFLISRLVALLATMNARVFSLSIRRITFSVDKGYFMMSSILHEQLVFF